MVWVVCLLIEEELWVCVFDVGAEISGRVKRSRGGGKFELMAKWPEQSRGVWVSEPETT
jgi:hypothetical protein